ncbi:DUF6932 family protein [Xanthomonas axonopodis]|uniref:DUF6932 family protein n=1 Tax=Xanthomonas axonopodis TaxID=53413 RepID=UPI0026863CC9
MPIPPFGINGVLPPYVGANGPGGQPEDMSPYAVSALEVVTTLGHSERRREILRGWLDHRAALRALGFDQGFQWLDGSFLEQKEPNDLDLISFLFRPQTALTAEELARLLHANRGIFERGLVKTTYKLDAFFTDMNASPIGLVNFTRYYLGLFSHRRGDDIWKGMLQVGLADIADDNAAQAVLGPAPLVSSQGVSP